MNAMIVFQQVLQSGLKPGFAVKHHIAIMEKMRQKGIGSIAAEIQISPLPVRIK